MITADTLVQAITRFKQSRVDLREPMKQSAVAVAIALKKERDSHLARLEARWKWCEQNLEHPAFIEREDALLADLVVYELIEDTLRMAALELFGEAA